MICRQQELLIRTDYLAQKLSEKRYKDFWNGVKTKRAFKVSEPSCIANRFGDINILFMWEQHLKQVFSSTIIDKNDVCRSLITVYHFVSESDLLDILASFAKQAKKENPLIQ